MDEPARTATVMSAAAKEALERWPYLATDGARERAKRRDSRLAFELGAQWASAELLADVTAWMNGFKPSLIALEGVLAKHRERTTEPEPS